MLQQTELAGSFTLPETVMNVNRMGYAAMQLAGRDGDKFVWGPPRDVDGAIALLGEAVASGVNLRENLQAAQLQIPSEVLANLNSIGEPEKEF